MPRTADRIACIKQGLKMSELALIKDFDGHPAVFCRFEGADKFVHKH